MQFYDPRTIWFGTIDRMRWIDSPKQGADMSPSAWGSGGPLLNGGGWERFSWGSHKMYTFEWRESSAVTAAQLMKSYRDGAFGRGLLYFLDPLTYEKNVLPARWASPAMACGYEGASHVYGIEPASVAVSGGAANDYPVASAQYDLTNAGYGYRGDRDTVFIPIPEGFTAYVGAVYTSTLTGGVYVSPVNSNGAVGSGVALTKVGLTDTNLVPNSFSGGTGIRLWVGKGSADASTVTITAITVRLYPTSLTPPASFYAGPWIGGMGHSGCRFSGAPTYIASSGIDDGRAEYAATFRETGDFE